MSTNKIIASFIKWNDSGHNNSTISHFEVWKAAVLDTLAIPYDRPGISSIENKAFNSLLEPFTRAYEDTYGSSCESKSKLLSFIDTHCREQVENQMSSYWPHFRTVNQLTLERNGLKEKLGNYADWNSLVQENTELKSQVRILRTPNRLKLVEPDCKNKDNSNNKPEHSGGNVDYYRVWIKQPKRPEVPAYYAECEDIILALGMTFSEGTVFKSLWRSCAARTLGKLKQGGDELRDAEKMIHYSQLTLKERTSRLKLTN